MIRKAYKIALSMVMITTIGCGSLDSIEGPKFKLPTDDFKGDDALPEDPNAVYLSGHHSTYDQEFYQHLFATRLALISDPDAMARQSPVLYVNFEGAFLRKGIGTSHSPLLCDYSASFDASELDPEQRNTVLAGVRQVFEKANIQIEVTDQRPSSGSFMTIHVARSFEDLGCASSTALGIAPIDKDNLYASDVAFVFSEQLRTAHMFAFAILHQTGAMLGLEAVIEERNFMHHQYSATASGFGPAVHHHSRASINNLSQLQENIAPPGTRLKLMGLTGSSSARTSLPGLEEIPGGLSNIRGIDVIASLGALLSDFAPDAKLDISKFISEIDEIVPGGLQNIQSIGGLQGIEDLMAVVLTSAEAAARDEGKAVESMGIATLLKAFLRPKDLESKDLLSLAGLAAKIGMAAASGGWAGAIMIAAEGLLSGLFDKDAGGDLASTSPSVNLTSLPNFSELLSIDEIGELSTLLATLEAHASLIHSNYRGRPRQALLSLLKLAYSQAFKKGGLRILPVQP